MSNDTRMIRLQKGTYNRDFLWSKSKSKSKKILFIVGTL